MSDRTQTNQLIYLSSSMDPNKLYPLKELKEEIHVSVLSLCLNRN